MNSTHKPVAILCIDDNFMITELTRETLENLGYKVTTENDAMLGIATFEWMKPDLVIVDYDMPVMNGHAIASEIRARDQKVPLILRSGFVNIPEDQTQCFSAVVAKEGSLEVLVREIRRLLGPDAVTAA